MTYAYPQMNAAARSPLYLPEVSYVSGIHAPKRPILVSRDCQKKL